MYEVVTLESGKRVYKFDNVLVNSNSYVVVFDDQLIIIDPGSDVYKILDFIKKFENKKLFVLLTHGHFDHVIGASDLSDAGGEIFMSGLDAIHLKRNNFYLKAFGEKYFCKDFNFKEISNLDLNGVTILSAPGHTVGSTVIKIDTAYFTGDTVLSRTVFAPTVRGVDRSSQSISVKNVFQFANSDCFIFPGHGSPGKLKDFMLQNFELRQILTNHYDVSASTWV